MNIIYLLETNTKMSVHLLTSMLSVNQVHVLYTCIKYVLIYLVHVYQSIYYMKTNTCLQRQVTRVCSKIIRSTEQQHRHRTIMICPHHWPHLCHPIVTWQLPQQIEYYWCSATGLTTLDIILLHSPSHSGYNFAVTQQLT